MNLKFTLGWEEYLAATEFFRRHNPSLSAEWIFFLLLLVTGAAWWALDGSLWVAVAAAAGATLVVAAAPKLRRVSLKRKWDREPLFRQPQAVAVSEQGIDILVGQFESKLGWNYYEHLLESDESFLLLYGETFSLLPKRAFAGEPMIEEFRRLVTENLPPSDQLLPAAG